MLDATVGADAADSVTADAASHIPKSYREGLSPDAFKGARYRRAPFVLGLRAGR
jgi:hypothetical protein